MMKDTRLLMGMPITIEICDSSATQKHLDMAFDYFQTVDEIFSTYRDSSEISRLNRGELRIEQCSEEVREILALSEQTRRETNGYFNIEHDGSLDPSGIVKGWAIFHAANLLREAGLHDYYVDAGGDIQVAGQKDDHLWRIGIRNPFNRYENVKVLSVTDVGVATSGTAIRGQHIYNPFQPNVQIVDILSLTVVGPNIYEADRFATAAFAMGRRGIRFIEDLPGFEGYMIDSDARATYTSGFERYVLSV